MKLIPCTVLLASGFIGSALGSEVRVPLDRAQLLLDDRLVEKSENLKRTVHQPTTHPANPVLTSDKPWEYSCVTLWGTVLYDEQNRVFKMWYQTWGNVDSRTTTSTFMCYATSKDGVKWEKPDLGLIAFNGDPHTNIVYVPKMRWFDSPTVVKDLSDPDPSRRYKMSFCEGGPGLEPTIWHATSPDGIRWTRLDGPVVRAGDRNSFFFDPLRKKWVVVTRMPGHAERTIGFAEGEEFGKYGPMRLVFRKDDKDPEKSDLYSMPTFAYEGMLIGCVEVYEHPTGRERTQLAWSHDGTTWTRDPERQPFMLWGEPPAWDWARRHPHNGPPILRDGRLWIYFGGRSTLKGSQDPRRIVGAIGVAVLRIDGFCSRDAGDTEATLLTRPLKLDANASELLVNADVKSGGALRVELLDDSGRALATSDTVTGDNVRHAVKWSGPREATPLAAAARGPVRLKFTMRKADLYSFRFR